MPSAKPQRGEGYMPQFTEWVERCDYLKQFAKDYGTVEMPLPKVQDVCNALYTSMGQQPTSKQHTQYDKITFFVKGLADVNGYPTLRTPTGRKLTAIMIELFPEFEKEIIKIEKPKKIARRVRLSVDRYDVLRFPNSRHFASCLKYVEGDTTSIQAKDMICNCKNPDFGVIYLGNEEDEILARQVVRVGYADNTFEGPVGLYLQARPYGATVFDFKKFLKEQKVPLGGIPRHSLIGEGKGAYGNGKVALEHWKPGLYVHDPVYGHFE